MIKRLDRRLGLASVIFVSLGSMLGSGIFVLPGLAYALTGPSIFIAYALAAICILPAAISKSELATAMPTSGGTYVYIESTFGPLAGTVSGLGLYTSLLLKAAFALMGFGAYLEVLHQVPIRLTALSLLTIIVGLNILGVGKVSSIVAIIVFIAVVSMGGLSGLAFFKMDLNLLEPMFTGGAPGLLSATAMVFVAYAGVTKIAAIAEEIKNPGKDVPKGILISLFLATTMYVVVSFFMASTLPANQLSGNLRPIYEMAQLVGGPTIAMIAAVIAILTMTSMANAGILAASRFPFAMGRDRLLPAIFGRINSRYLTPVWSIILSGVVVGAAIVLLNIEKMAKLASVFMILMFIAVNVAVIVLREARVQWYQPAYKSFAYPYMQIFGIISCSILLVAMGNIVPTALMAIGIPGVFLYIFFSRKRTDRRGVLGIRGPRKDLVEEQSPTKPVRRIDEMNFAEDAKVIVSMFGKERSPEVLTEMGLALADGTNLEVVHLTEIPEQTGLADIAEENSDMRAIRRRVNHMSLRQSAPLRFDPILSHDIFKTVNDLTARLHCAWLVIEWGGNTSGAFTLHNPIGWLRDHLSCHLMTFTDKGVRYFKKILVIVKTEKSNLLLLDTADHLARVNDAEVTLCAYIPSEAHTEMLDWQQELLEGMRKRCKYAVGTQVVSGPKEWQAFAKATEEFDLVIFEAEIVTSWYQRFFGSTYDKLMENSACSVVSVQSNRDLMSAKSFRRRFLASAQMWGKRP